MRTVWDDLPQLSLTRSLTPQHLKEGQGTGLALDRAAWAISSQMSYGA